MRHIDSHGALEAELFPLLTVCRRLGSLVHDQLYHGISVQTVDRANMLRDALFAVPARRCLIEKLRLSPLIATDPDDDDAAAWEAHEQNNYMASDEGVPELLLLLDKLPGIRELRLLDFSLGALTKIARRVAVRSSCLEVLQLCFIKHTGSAVEAEAGRVSLWASLAKLPQLGALFFGPDCDVILMPSTGAPLCSLISVRKVGVTAGNSTGMTARPLDAVLPALQKFAVDGDNMSRTMAQHWLRTAPITVTRLKLMGEFDFDTQDYLERLPNLTHLTMTEGSFDPPRFLLYLAESSLRILEFDPRSPVSDIFLHKMIAGPRRVKSLLRLVLDHHAPPLSKSALRLQLEEVVEDQSLIKLAASRERARPVWPNGCTETGLEAILAAAASNGVAVEGAALRCLGWERRFDEELERCLVEHAHPEEPHAVLEEVLGRDRAVKALRSRRPELVMLAEGDCEAGGMSARTLEE